MSKWLAPNLATRPLHSIMAGGEWGVIRSDGIAPASTTFPTANKVIYVPIVVPELITVNQMKCWNGAAVSGNIAMGVYDISGNRLINTGTTAHATVSDWQIINVTDTVLYPDLYFLALTCSNTTSAFACWTVGNSGIAQVAESIGLRFETPGVFGLPTTATFSVAVNAIVPQFGILCGAAI